MNFGLWRALLGSIGLIGLQISTIQRNELAEVFFAACVTFGLWGQVHK